ncbi:uncharacterized protein Dmoj_GI12700 [Drosophila mojavensis]|uniref:Uncharacterized protein n=1 Tax=Drosophila mojavensis TaxID=7230 RepID=B4KWP4_DROMO|nr:uncharacterized protein Dmoj_GI12700 [Drosophila mojavensis]
MFLALACALLTLLCCHSLLAATVRPYKFGFTIEEQQHRSESRDENGIVMGEFGFITADGIYHVTVYATDENGKFRIISMKNFPYAGPKAPKSPPPTTSTQRIPTPVTKHNFHTVACSGCFLGNSSPETKSNPASAEGHRNTKNEIRPLSQPLSRRQPLCQVLSQFNNQSVQLAMRHLDQP